MDQKHIKFFAAKDKNRETRENEKKEVKRRQKGGKGRKKEKKRREEEICFKNSSWKVIKHSEPSEREARTTCERRGKNYPSRLWTTCADPDIYIWYAISKEIPSSFFRHLSAASPLRVALPRMSRERTVSALSLFKARSSTFLFQTLENTAGVAMLLCVSGLVYLFVRAVCVLHIFVKYLKTIQDQWGRFDYVVAKRGYSSAVC